MAEDSRKQSKLEANLIALSLGVAPGVKRIPYNPVRYLNEKIGFWISAHDRSPVVVKDQKFTLREFVWGCGCNALASSGKVVQYVPCKEHGTDTDSAFEFED